ncbi:EfeM/EfeO family lipoprotein [Streptacidiphilus jiangxiensis]|uniref:High-affinity iron transporter n=1 Tax=Streptacidiphilus jiangxiensis TaxID=235985 RepID=A0A1H7TM40_STRJI|nr:EfeM/EfeO family lipoprotein [Streptacidiphilus jiangxiensis]SEL85920.1 high-affinity iron transporter [Streptacidiphilus jiangxiensis]
MTVRPWFRRPPLAGALALAVAGGALAVAFTSDDAPASAGASTLTVSVDKHGCGAPPARLPSGPVVFEVTDAATTFVTVYLTDPGGARAYAEIRWLGPRHSLPLSASVAAGRYALRCVFSDGPVVTSPPVAVTGSAPDTEPGYRPMTSTDLEQPVTAYRAWVSAALPRLLDAARALDADVARGDLAAARTDWLSAHLAYERLGAAYNSFGDFDDAIDGRPDGLPGGVDDPGWTGFLAIEHTLWHGSTADRVRPLTQKLVSDVTGLIADFPSEDIDSEDLPLRAHEILENALQFQLTGHDDQGSGTTLATLDANVQGTSEVLSLLTPLLNERDPGLVDHLDQALTALRTSLQAASAAGSGGTGGWTAADALDRATRERLDGALGSLLEQLARIPNLLAARNAA